MESDQMLRTSGRISDDEQYNRGSVGVNHGERQCLSETSSRCLTESVTAAHNFEVTNYPLLDGMGVGKYVSSSTFSVGGYDWCIRFYPDGWKEDCAGNASAFLYCVSGAKDVRTKFTLNMLEKEGKVQLTDLGVLKQAFSPPSYDWGYSKFVEKSKLKSSTHINNSYLTIRCVLTVIKESRTEAKANLIMVPWPNLQDHLEHMWKDGEGADVTFSVCGQLFNAHRCLLAARSALWPDEGDNTAHQD